MIPAVVEHFGLVISSFLNAVFHRDALRLRDVKIGGMLGTFLGTVSGAQGLSRGRSWGFRRGILMTTGMFWRRSTLPFGVFLAVPGVLPLLASRSPRSFALQHVGYHKLPAGAVFDGEVPDHDLLSYESKGFVSHTRSRARQCTSGSLIKLQRGVSKPGVPGPERGGAG